MARSLAARIALAFAALSLALLVGVGTATFVVLRDLHTEATYARLADIADGLAGRARELVAAGASPREALAAIGATIPGGVSVTFRTADGRLVNLDGGGPEGTVDVDPASASGVITHGTARDASGRTLLFAAVAIRPAAVAGGARAIVVSVSDASGTDALRDVARTLPVLAFVLLLVGIPAGWLLWRSVAGPLRRLSDATADVQMRRSEVLPLEGPTEVRELTGHFNAMTEELERRGRAEADLLAGLRHDLRTPLTVIGGFAEALRDGTASGQDADRAARAIAEETDRLATMLAELDLVGDADASDALHPEAIDVAATVDGTVMRFGARADAAGITLVADAGAVGDVHALADPVALDRILANVVENALEATPAGGTVRISARGEPAAEHARRGRRRAGASAAPARFVRFVVEDDGRGFPVGTRERVFERFFRADPSRSGPGSGLGLAIVRDLARAQQGDAWAEDVAPHGARVIVRLPAAPLHAATGPSPEDRRIADDPPPTPV
jgi:two-component system OmpR family sensor kinase